MAGHRDLRTRYHGLQSFGKWHLECIQASDCHFNQQKIDCYLQEHEQKAAGAFGEEALKHAIAAAELYMQAAQKAPTQADRTRLSHKCRTMIDLAEKLKSLSVNPEPRGPKSTRPLSTAEKTIILRSSKIHGQVFLPWDAPPGPSAFAKTGEEMYMYGVARFAAILPAVVC